MRPLLLLFRFWLFSLVSLSYATSLPLSTVAGVSFFPRCPLVTVYSIISFKVKYRFAFHKFHT